MVKSTENKTIVKAKLKELYNTKLKKELQNELSLTNSFQVPILDKIVINSGVGKAKDDKKTIEAVINTITKITGQIPVQTVAKNSIAGFKLREGNVIGVKVTLRREKMYEFTDRLINIVLPRLRDFHGVSLTAFDKQGNYSLGLTDQSVFPELTFEETTLSHGLQINFVFRSIKPEHSVLLLNKFGMPFSKENK